jgi:hypothetical protein
MPVIKITPKVVSKATFGVIFVSKNENRTIQNGK